MKKMLILALIALFYIGASVLIQPQNVVVDDDVGICYVLPTDQTSDMVMYVAENNTPSMPDYRSLYSGVEKPDYTITLNSRFDVQYMYNKRDYSTPAKMTNPQGSNSMNTDLRGLLTEYVSPRDGAKSRHT